MLSIWIREGMRILNDFVHNTPNCPNVICTNVNVRITHPFENLRSPVYQVSHNSLISLKGNGRQQSRTKVSNNKMVTKNLGTLTIQPHNVVQLQIKMSMALGGYVLDAQ